MVDGLMADFPLHKGWIGVDLDGTLAEYHGWVNEEHIGKPIGIMVARVRAWLSQGIEVRIFTARAAEFDHKPNARRAIELWCAEHIGQVLAITCQKDYQMVRLWDDRAVTVVQNTGYSLAEWSAMAESSGRQ